MNIVRVITLIRYIRICRVCVRFTGEDQLGRMSGQWAIPRDKLELPGTRCAPAKLNKAIRERQHPTT